MFSKKLAKAKKLVQNLFSNKIGIYKPPEEISYFERMPFDVLIPIFDHLELADVIKCENITLQTHEAAAHFYRREYSTFDFNSTALSYLARSRDRSHHSNLHFARTMFSVIGPHIQNLYIDYPSFCIEWVRPLSEMIREYCGNLTIVTITGIPGHRIAMVNMKNVKVMGIFNCLFDNQPALATSRKLKKLIYLSQCSLSTTNIVRLILQFPAINDLTIDTNCVPTNHLRSVASLSYLKMLVIEIIQAESDEELKMQKTMDFSLFFKEIQKLPRLALLELKLPFYMRLSHEIIDTSIKLLRRKCNKVNLTATAFNEYEPIDFIDLEAHQTLNMPKLYYLEPHQIRSLRDDLDGLSGIHSSIKFLQNDSLMTLSTFVRLEVLRLSLCGRLGEFDNHQIVGVLSALVEGARMEVCCLQEVVLNACSTKPVDITHLPSIVNFVQFAKQLKFLTVYNCTEELIKQKGSVQTENVVVVFQ